MRCVLNVVMRGTDALPEVVRVTPERSSSSSHPHTLLSLHVTLISASHSYNTYNSDAYA